MSYDIGPRIGIEGEAEFRKSIRDVNASLKAMSAEMKAVTSAYAAGDQSEEKLRKQNELLNRQIEAQKTKLSELSSMLEKSKTKYGETDEKTQKWQRAVNEATVELNRLDSELSDNISAIQRADEANTEFAKAQRVAEEAAEQLRQEQERLASQVAQTSGKLQQSSEIANKANKAFLLTAGGVAAAGAAIGALAGNTREYREEQGKLITAFESAGFSANDAKNTYKELYSILSDSGQATEASQLLAKLSKSVEDVSSWTDIATGVVGTFGDSLPIESLIEASNETAKVGKVTGALADALNWVGVSEDDFNEKLSDCADESKRTALITKTLNGLYSESAKAYKKNNEAIIEANKNQVSLSETTAEIGEVAERAKNKLVKAFAPAIKEVGEETAEFIDNLSNGELDNELKVIASTAAAAGVALAALNASLAVKDVINFTKAVKVGGAAIESYTAATKAGALAQGALNLAQTLSPMGWLAVAAGAAATAFITYKAMTHESTSTTAILSDEIKELNEELEEQTARQNELAEARSESLGDVNREISLVENYVGELENLTDENGRVNEKYKERASYLAEQINSLIPDAIKITEDEAGAYYKVSDAIEDMLFHKKKEMVLAAWEVEYKDALKNRSAAVDELREASEKQSAAEEEVNRIRQEALSATGQELLNLQVEQAEADKALRESTEATNKANDSLKRYNQVASAYTAAEMASETDQLNASIVGFSNTLVKATGDNEAELEKGVANTKANLDIIVGQHGAAWDNMTEAQRQAARDQVAEFKARLDEQVKEAKRGGVEFPESFGTGITEGSPLFSAAMTEMFDQGKKTIETAGVELKDVGHGYDVILKQGIESGSEEVKKASGTVVGDAIKAAEKKSEEASSTGAFFTEGFAEGIKSKGPMGAVWSAAWSMAMTAKKAAEEAGDVNSPSRVMKRIGKYYSEGFGIGITDGISYARKAAHKLGDAVISEIADLNKELAQMEAKDRVEQAAKELADHEKAIEEKYEELGKAEKDEKQKILDEIAELQDDWNEKQVKAEKDAAKLALQEKIKTLEDFKKEYDSALSELENKQRSMSDKLSGYGNLFENVTSKSGREYLKLGDLQEDIDKIKEYGDALEELKEHGISDSLMSEITSMPIDDAISYTTELLEKTPKEYDKYMELWEEKQKLSGEVAKQFYQDEFDHLQTEFVDKVPQELSKLKDEMQGIGKNSAIGLADGFWSKKAYITSTFKSVLEAALQEAKDAMEIHSPSRRWAEVGSFMAQGLGVGFTDQMRNVAKQINNSIPVSVETNTATATTTKAVEGMVNGLAPLMAANQGQGGTYVINVMLPDGTKLADAVFDPLKDISRQRGVKP